MRTAWAAVPCEVCDAEPAYSFAWFPDRARWYAARSGTWRFTGHCTADFEHYYVLFHAPTGRGFCDSLAEQADWWRHLRGKDWFNPLDFGAMLDRFRAAGGQVTPRRRARAV